MLNPKIANRIWLFTQRRQYRLFLKNSGAVEAYQLGKLRAYIAGNEDTVFGRAHDFSGINSYADFVAKVPVQDWSAIEPYVNRIAEGEKNILTAQKVIRFEETSGTTKASKLIPYTDDLLAEFQSAVACWMCDLYEQQPQVFSGKAYWSISPTTRQQRRTAGGIPIGVADDTAYFNPFVSLLLNSILAVPGGVGKLQADEFYLTSLAYLLANENLAFISAWSPAFLLAMDDFLQKNWSEILTSDVFLELATTKRGEELSEVLAGNFTWDDVWKKLPVISCWTDAQAYLQSQHLQARLGSISIQGKGLLSTECVCSIPMSGGVFPALSYLSHFYEFREMDTSQIYLAHEVKVGAVYEIIVTTGGGLYRYATADLVEITGHIAQVPCFKFLGRKNKQSDLVGEKLSEIQVNRTIKILFVGLQQKVEWVFLASQKTDTTFYHYVLNIEMKPGENLENLQQLTCRFEQILFENPYYKEAISLGQLKALQIHVLPIGTQKKYLAQIKNNGQAKEAVIKNATLLTADQYLVIRKLSP